eukprot:2453893-Rhodomonas_salina.1
MVDGVFVRVQGLDKEEIRAAAGVLQEQPVEEDGDRRGVLVSAQLLDREVARASEAQRTVLLVDDRDGPLHERRLSKGARVREPTVRDDELRWKDDTDHVIVLESIAQTEGSGHVRARRDRWFMLRGREDDRAEVICVYVDLQLELVEHDRSAPISVDGRQK